MNWARVVTVVPLLKYLAEYSTQRLFVEVVHLMFECGHGSLTLSPLTLPSPRWGEGKMKSLSSEHLSPLMAFIIIDATKGRN